MKNDSKLTDFLYGKVLLRSRYGFEITETDYIEHAMLILETELRTPVQTNYVCTSVVGSDLSVPLPKVTIDNISDVLVTSTTTVTQPGLNIPGRVATIHDPNTGHLMGTSNTEAHNIKRQTDKIKGTGVSFEYFRGNLMVFDKTLKGKAVTIKFAVDLTDSDNLPRITLITAQALAANVASILTLRKALSGDKLQVNNVQIITAIATDLMTKARMPSEPLTNYDLNRIFNATKSGDKHVYGYNTST